MSIAIEGQGPLYQTQQITKHLPHHRKFYQTVFLDSLKHSGVCGGNALSAQWGRGPNAGGAATSPVCGQVLFSSVQTELQVVAL